MSKRIVLFYADSLIIQNAKVKEGHRVFSTLDGLACFVV